MEQNAAGKAAENGENAELIGTNAENEIRQITTAMRFRFTMPLFTG